jgi:uncharacterized protein
MEPERVTFTTYDEIDLVGHLYLPGGVSAGDWVPGIVGLHGFGSRKERHHAFGVRAARAGHAVLLVDLRGHGESGGEMDANLFNDVAAAYLYLQNRPEVDPMRIGVRGSSMGGWLAIHTAAHMSEISPVIAYCPPNDASMSILLDEAAMVQRGIESPMLQGPLPRLNVNSTMQLVYRLDITKSARRLSPRPLLLVHCEEDQVVPPHISQRIYEVASEPKTLWLLPGCDHQFAQHDPLTDSRVLDWMRMNGPPSSKLTTKGIVAEELDRK